jgi:hypothetical protein|tara:strand:- start:47 stop:727 length:681 start_codon:yes stop_codon:yes gene_type:complete
MDVRNQVFITRSGSFFILIASLSTAQATVISDLLITEVMANPSAVYDNIGEWFELFNPTRDDFNLNQVIITDDGFKSHQINPTGSLPLLIKSKGYFVLALSSTKTLNGGFKADYVYDYNDFKLANNGDEIILIDSLNNELRLDYSSSFVASGRSRELVSMPMSQVNYQLTASTETYGDGDIGTPGAPGSVQFAPISVAEPSSIVLFILACMLYFAIQFKIQVKRKT